MAHMLYLDCKTGRSKRKSDEFKQNHPLAYQPFARWSFQNRGAPNATDSFKMNHYDPDTETTVKVEQHEKLQEFFQGLPDTYYSYVDASDLGEFSYTYLYDSNLESLFDTMECVSELNATAPRRFKQRQRKLTAASGWRAYLVDQLEAKQLSTLEIEEQLGLIHCIVHAEHYGLEDYTEEFRKNFNLTADEHAPCIERVIEYEDARIQGRDLVQLNSEWRTKFHDFFPNTRAV